jgi:hypothetical protein
VRARRLGAVVVGAGGISALVAFAQPVIGTVVVVTLAFAWTWWLERSSR